MAHVLVDYFARDPRALAAEEAMMSSAVLVGELDVVDAGAAALRLLHAHRYQGVA